MSRIPIRVRLTAAFALAMALVLAGAAAFIYVRLRADLDEGIATRVEARAGAIAANPKPRASGALEGVRSGDFDEADERFAQLLDASGRVLATGGGARAPALTAAQAADAARTGVLTVTRPVDGIEGEARIAARRAIPPTARGPVVVAVGESLEDRDETLAGILASFAVGGPVAIAIASLAGYSLAAAGLRPVETMRRRAGEISLGEGGDRLPVPRARDEVRRLGETLNEMLDRLRRSFDRERRFVADASHELRTPLAVIKTELESALRSDDVGPHGREPLVAAVEECDRLNRLAEDLLVIARAGEGELPVRREAVKVRALLERARDQFADRAAERYRVVEIEADAELSVSADPLRLRQALANLLDNALRHGKGAVTLSARQVGGGAQVCVADAGPGLAPELADRAFERFARGDEARARGGAGLGLPIVRAIAEAHGGSASILPRPSTVVCLWLPAGPSETRGPSPARLSALW